MRFADAVYISRVYNGRVKVNNDVIKLLRIASLLWLAYLAISAAIDYSLKSPGPTDRYIYLSDGAIALFFFGLTFWSWVIKRLEGSFLPFVIFLVCALPVGVNQVAIRYLFSGPLPAPANLLASAVPFLLIALILIAWQYSWRHILLFSLAVAALNILFLWVFYPYKQEPFTAGLFAILNQVVIFLVVGFFINVLVGWLNRQKRELEEANLRLTNYSRTLEDLAVSRERTRIAQELHDTLSHTLSGLSVQLETMKAYWDVDRGTARTVLDKSLAAARSGLDETRRALSALRARPLEELGLAPAIRALAEEASAKAGLALELNLDDAVRCLSSEAEHSLYRVAQESIANVLKHASAHALSVSLTTEADKTVLSIKDDGVGFKPGNEAESGHFGLLGMRERVEALGGEFQVSSSPGSGTEVRVSV